MTVPVISAIANHKNTILRQVAAWLLPVLFCKGVSLPARLELEATYSYLKRIGKLHSFRITDPELGHDLVFTGWGLPQFFPQQLKYLSAAEFFLSLPTVRGWVELEQAGDALSLDTLPYLIPCFREQEQSKFSLLMQYEHDPDVASYALLHVELHRWIRGFIKVAAGIETADLPTNTHQRLREPASLYLLNFVHQWLSKGKPLTAEMEKFLDYLLSSSNDKVIGFPEFKSTYLIGLVGEQILAEELGGTVVGNLGKKADVQAMNHSFSVKSTKNDYWQSHLAYLSIQDYPQLSKVVSNNMPLREMGFSDEQWAAFIHKFLCAEDNLEYLVFQKLQLEEACETVLSQDVWICRTRTLIDLVKQGHYFFRNSSFSIVAPNKEVIMSFQLKRRNEGKKIQVMINTDTQLLANATTCVPGISILKQTLPL